MKAKLVGLIETQGVFEGNPYHKVNLHCTAPCMDNGFYGVQVIDPKLTSIKFDNIAFIVGRPMTVAEFSTYVGSDINLDFDQKKRVVGIHFYADDYEPVEPAKK